jgi:hypothetical protein
LNESFQLESPFFTGACSIVSLAVGRRPILIAISSLKMQVALDRSVQYVGVMRVCDSKLRLLQTAHELIWRQSYGSVGVDQICEQSGVKKGSFYHFFRSKSELTVAAYEYYWEQSRLTLDGIF